MTISNDAKCRQALVVLAPGFEEIEAVTVIDVLRRAGIHTVVASLEEDTTVTGSHAITVRADIPLSNVDINVYAAVVLPGGMHGVEHMMRSEPLGSMILQMDKKEAVLAAVCAAPLVLDALGLLQNRSFTCHPGVRDRISQTPRDVAVIIDGRLITGRSAGCAMEWSLALVGHLLGRAPDSLRSSLSLP